MDFVVGRRELDNSKHHHHSIEFITDF
jgi:hypothetical protein